MCPFLCLAVKMPIITAREELCATFVNLFALGITSQELIGRRRNIFEQAIIEHHSKVMRQYVGFFLL